MLTGNRTELLQTSPEMMADAEGEEGDDNQRQGLVNKNCRT